MYRKELGYTAVWNIRLMRSPSGNHHCTVEKHFFIYIVEAQLGKKKRTYFVPVSNC